jgi:hypothetical protein
LPARRLLLKGALGIGFPIVGTKWAQLGTKQGNTNESHLMLFRWSGLF